LLFGFLNILGVKKAGIVQMVLAVLLAVSVFTLFIAALSSPYATVQNMLPWWGFDKSAAVAAGGYAAEHAVHSSGIAGSILATFAIAPWAFVGFDTIPQVAEECKFSYKKIIFIMVVAIFFGCFVYISNNTIAAAALENWPDLIVDAEGTPWLLLVAAERLLGTFGKVLVGVAVSSAVLSGIMGFYLASSRLMYSMSNEGYLPKVFGKIDEKYRTPKNAMLFCMLISLAGPAANAAAALFALPLCLARIGGSYPPLVALIMALTAAANLLPIGDLDGGRILSAFLAERLPLGSAERVSAAASVATVSLGLFVSLAFLAESGACFYSSLFFFFLLFTLA
jgi:amino acid transporter